MHTWPRLGVVVSDLFGIKLERGARGGNRKEVSDSGSRGFNAPVFG